MSDITINSWVLTIIPLLSALAGGGLAIFGNVLNNKYKEKERVRLQKELLIEKKEKHANSIRRGFYNTYLELTNALATFKRMKVFYDKIKFDESVFKKQVDNIKVDNIRKLNEIILDRKDFNMAMEMQSIIIMKNTLYDTLDLDISKKNTEIILKGLIDDGIIKLDQKTKKVKKHIEKLLK